MKRVKFLMAACLLCASLIAQPTYPHVDKRGIWIYSASPANLTEFRQHLEAVKNQVTIKGVLISFAWHKLQPGVPASLPKEGEDHHTDATSYDWNERMDKFMNAIWEVNPDWYIGIMLWASQDAPIGNAVDNASCGRDPATAGQPNWLWNRSTHKVNRFVTEKSGKNYYPDYFGRSDVTTDNPYPLIPQHSNYQAFWNQFLRDAFNHITKDNVLTNVIIIK